MTEPRPKWVNPYTDLPHRELYRYGYLWRYSCCGYKKPPDNYRTAWEYPVVMEGWNAADAVIKANTPKPDEPTPTDNPTP